MKNKKHTSRNLEDHIEGRAVIKDDAGTIDKDHVGVEWEATQGEVESTTTLEDDKGNGIPIVIRFFEFSANLETFKLYTPTKQELFNSHKEQIAWELKQADLQVYEGFEPKINISKNKKSYRIVVAGLPWGMNRAHIPTLSEIANGNS